MQVWKQRLELGIEKAGMCSPSAPLMKRKTHIMKRGKSMFIMPTFPPYLTDVSGTPSEVIQVLHSSHNMTSYHAEYDSSIEGSLGFFVVQHGL